MSDAPAKPGPWKKPSELARELGCDRSTVWNYVTKGLAEVSRMAPRTCVRVRLAEEKKAEDLKA